ncbi:hypothetical protein [Embleya hyalina]|uniref:Tail assembly chaperone n=1 Tax=Embleya hyalina TaxID=516124 RepID=A0A401YHN0_9ACTN|nr:hypothetical protein [Embleya hyalina]GCD94077.1 hypothetical protein EHYA_01733 [Embleya hyalina]
MSEHVQPLEAEDFDAWVSETNANIRPASIKIGGTVHVMPVGVPIAFTLQTRRLADREDVGALRTILVPIFGEQALDAWESTSPFGTEALPVLLRWCGANMAKPGSMSIAEAAASVEEDDAGKAPKNRAEKRAAAKKTKSSGKRS